MAARTPQPICEIDGVSLVFLGSFNPAILQPQWLARHGLVGEEEAAAAKIEIIRPEVLSVQIGPFLINVTHDRASFETASSGFADVLSDLVSGVFGILAETPITAIGINRNMHFRMATEGAWHAVGHTLAPKEHWENILDNPGTRSVTVRGIRSGRPEAVVHVTVEPSVRLAHGVSVAYNEQTGASSVTEALTQIEQHFQGASDHAMQSALRIVELGSDK